MPSAQSGAVDAPASAGRVPDDEPRLVARLIELATLYGRYGYRRITGLLRGEGWTVNHKRIERLWRREGTVKLSNLAAFSPPAATAKSLILSL